MRECNVFCVTLLTLALVSLGIKANSKENGSIEPLRRTSEYTVAAYIWPSCHDDSMGREVLWPDGTEILVFLVIISRRSHCGDMNWIMTRK